MWAKLNINSDICKFSDKILTIIILIRKKRGGKSHAQRKVKSKAIKN